MTVWSDVVVLFGGASAERKVSVATAQHLAERMGDVELWCWGVDGAVRLFRVRRSAPAVDGGT